MKNNNNEPPELPEGFDTTLASLQKLAASFSEIGLNTIPFKGSWTGGQVLEHVMRSNRSITQALDMPGKPVDRNAHERTPELAKIFLDFDTKLKSPDFILPTQEVYGKSALLKAFEVSVDNLKQAAGQVVLTDAIEHVAFGEITKMELLYFVVYHTQRHTRQLHRIYEMVENRQYKLLSFLFMQPLSLF
jgi:hypothetical protein